MLALLVAACLALAPVSEQPAPSRIVLPPSGPDVVTVRDDAGQVVATVRVGSDAGTTVFVPPGAYTLQGKDGAEPIVVVEGQASRPQGAADADLVAASQAAPPPSSLPPASADSEARMPEHGAKTKAWRAPLMGAFVPGLGHAYAGRPYVGVGILVATLGATVGAVALGLAGDPADGATPSDASRRRGYARLGGLAALSSLAGTLYLAQIFDAHRLERGTPLRPEPGRVRLRLDRLSAISMAPGRPAAALYDDFSLAAMIRVHPRVRVGPADLGLKFGSGTSVVQGGARAMAMVLGPSPEHPLRRLELQAGGGVLLQGTTAQRTSRPLDPQREPTASTERALGAAPYLMAEGRVYVARRWSVGALGRVSVPLTPRRYARGRALPAYATTFEFGASMGVNL